jgi:hypothetical protein
MRAASNPSAVTHLAMAAGPIPLQPPTFGPCPPDLWRRVWMMAPLPWRKRCRYALDRPARQERCHRRLASSWSDRGDRNLESRTHDARHQGRVSKRYHTVRSWDESTPQAAIRADPRTRPESGFIPPTEIVCGPDRCGGARRSGRAPLASCARLRAGCALCHRPSPRRPEEPHGGEGRVEPTTGPLSKTGRSLAQRRSVPDPIQLRCGVEAGLGLASERPAARVIPFSCRGLAPGEST